jgi:ABC-2 type transport system ATP-binding protein
MDSEAGRHAAGSPAVEVVDLVKSYDSVTAVAGISFALERGAVTALLGGNGAGKTTTIAMLMGLVVPTSGTVRVLGADMARNRHQVLHRINFESPYADIPMRLTVAENLKVFGRLYGVADLGRQLAKVAAEMRIDELMDRPYGKLSAGQKTRVSLAKALLNRPEVLLLDEPTASLDPDTADWVRTHIETYARETGATIVLASHNMAEVERLASRVIMLERGRILADEPPAALLQRFGRDTLEEVFLAIARRGSDTAIGGVAAQGGT